jgi:hypothetical protein
LRQADNKPFAELLNRLREVQHTTLDIATLEERRMDPSSEDYPKEVPHLFATNDQVNSFNDKVIMEMNSPKFSIPAKYLVVGSSPSSMKEKTLNSSRTAHKQSSFKIIFRFLK